MMNGITQVKVPEVKVNYTPRLCPRCNDYHTYWVCPHCKVTNNEQPNVSISTCYACGLKVELIPTPNKPLNEVQHTPKDIVNG
jgi:hypothetical protein